MARISTLYGPTPDAGEYAVARPLYGRTVTGAGEIIKAGVGFRWLRVTPHLAQLGLATRDRGNIGGLLSEWHHRWITSPLARYVYVGIWLYAEDTATVHPSVSASLNNTGGGIIDGPLAWTQVNGFLPSDDYTAVGGTACYLGATTDRDRYVHTGWNSVALGGGNTPRLLDLGAAGGGLDVDLVISTVLTRIYSIVTIEAYREEI